MRHVIEKDIDMSSCSEVTVLMPVYNGEKYLRQAIDSILEQTFLDFEFLILNDGSTDRTMEIVESYNDSRIRMVHNEKNMKLIFTLNKGINLARGKYIARMDCDDISLPERLTKQVAFMDEHPEVGILGGSIYIIDGNGKRKYKVQYPTKHHVFCWGLCFYCPVAHPTVMMRKEVIVSVGGYNNDMVHAEDYDLWYRLNRRTNFANLKDVLLYLRKHENCVSETYSSIHSENSTKVNQKIVSGVLGEYVNFQLIECIRKRKFESSSEHVQASNLVKRLYQSFANDKGLSSEERRLIRKDAAFRLFIIAALRIYDVLVWGFLLFAFRLDPLVLISVLRFLFRRVLH